MKNLIGSIVALGAIALFQAPCAYAQTVSQLVPTPVAVVQQAATPALWVVKDADTTIYLFGTFHFLPDGVNWNLGPVKSAFESADTLKLEIASLAEEAPAIGAIVAQKGNLPAGKRLDDGLTPQQKVALSRVISEAGIAPETVATMRPWLASVVLSANLFQKIGLDPNKGVDKTLEGLARARNMPVLGFETGGEQINFLADLSPAQERALLLSTLEDWGQAKSAVDAMLTAWSRGDASKIAAAMSDSLRSQPELARILLTDRNRRWADWISGRMQTPGTVFVAVGAGHLAGGDSVQSFLSKKGLRALRIANRTR